MKEENLQKVGKELKPIEKKEEAMLIRILATDIPGNKKVLPGLTRIKGVSWSFANSMCKVLKIDKNKEVKDLSKEEIGEIIKFVQNPKLPEFMLNRRKDLETGENKHIMGADLDLRKEFDIKRLKKIKSYKGLRHATGQPVRGQRTRSHFRENKTVGVVGKAKRGKKG